MSDEQRRAMEHFQEFTRRRAAESAVADKATCKSCGGTGYFRQMDDDGYEVVRPCICLREKRLKNAIIAARIPAKYRDKTLIRNPDDERRIPFRPWGGKERDVVAIESQKKAVELLLDLKTTYLEYFLEKKNQDKDLYGLMLYGPYGRGKTHLISALLCDLIHEGLTDVLFMEYSELFKLIRFSYDAKEESAKGLFNRLTSTKVLAIDDFGMEISNNLVWILDNIGYIINERYARGLPTLFTSNFWISAEERDQKSALREKVEQIGNPYENTPSFRAKDAFQEMEKEMEAMQNLKDHNDRISLRLMSRINEVCYEHKLEGFDYRAKLGRTREMARKIQMEKQRKRS